MWALTQAKIALTGELGAKINLGQLAFMTIRLAGELDRTPATTNLCDFGAQDNGRSEIRITSVPLDLHSTLLRNHNGPIYIGSRSAASC